MKDLNLLFKECIQELDEISIPYGKVNNIQINNRLTRTWGRCRTFRNGSNSYENYTFLIEISPRILKDDMDDTYAKGTIIHEILHTCKDCQNHHSEWQKWARKVNKKYPQYKIKRTSSYEEMGVDFNEEYKYVIYCKECSRKWGYRRKTRVVQNVNRCNCPICKKKTLALKEN